MAYEDYINLDYVNLNTAVINNNIDLKDAQQLILDDLFNRGVNKVGIGEFNLQSKGRFYSLNLNTLYIEDCINPELSPIEDKITCDIFKVSKVMYVQGYLILSTNLLNK